MKNTDDSSFYKEITGLTWKVSWAQKSADETWGMETASLERTDFFTKYKLTVMKSDVRDMELHTII